MREDHRNQCLEGATKERFVIKFYGWVGLDGI